MSLTTILFGLIPLIAFVVIDSFAGVRAGIISAVIFALIELVYTLVMYKKIDGITVGSLATVLVFGLLSYRSGSSMYFKMQPVVFGVVFGGVLLLMQAFDKPLLVILMKKYRYILPQEMRDQILQPYFLSFLKKSSLTLGWGFLIHASFVAYAALKMSNWWWLGIRGVGVYLMMFACMMVAKLI